MFLDKTVYTLASILVRLRPCSVLAHPLEAVTYPIGLYIGVRCWFSVKFYASRDVLTALSGICGGRLLPEFGPKNRTTCSGACVRLM